MLLKLPNAYVLVPSIALLLTISSCSSLPNAGSSAPEPYTQSPAAPVESQVPLAVTATATAGNPDALAAVSTVQVTPSPTLTPVTITAVNGNLAIRSGPDPVFDTIEVLRDGESAPVLARSVLDGWVEIPIPGQGTTTGWVSIKTSYSLVNGDVLDLPEIMTVEWPSGSYIRNCTDHKMVIEPTDLQLAPSSGTPKNRAWFPPGLYTVHDLDAAGQPFVMQIQLASHTQFDIGIDGNRERWICP